MNLCNNSKLTKMVVVMKDGLVIEFKKNEKEFKWFGLYALILELSGS